MLVNLTVFANLLTSSLMKDKPAWFEHLHPMHDAFSYSFYSQSIHLHFKEVLLARAFFRIAIDDQCL